MEVAIKHVDDGQEGRITLFKEIVAIGELIYSWIGDNTFAITSTEVDPAYRGAGLARRLVIEAATVAHERQALIVPQCSYARAVLERDPNLRALIAD